MVHIYRCLDPKRVRVYCPHHKHLCYGEKQEFYDTVRIFFDCGTFIDYGYGYFTPPKLYKRINIFKDSEGYTAWVPRAGWVKIANQVSLPQVERMARRRLQSGGVIIYK